MKQIEVVIFDEAEIDRQARALEAMEESAAMLDEIASVLADSAATYLDYAELVSEISDDSEDIKNGRRQAFALPYAFAHVRRHSVKLWRVNRAVYRPYDGVRLIYVYLYYSTVRGIRRLNHELF